jgi:hypothetical protein
MGGISFRLSFPPPVSQLQLSINLMSFSDSILEAVAESFHVTPDEIKQRGKNGGVQDQNLVEARYATFWIMRQYLFKVREISELTGGHPIGTIHTGEMRAHEMLRKKRYAEFRKKVARAAQQVARKQPAAA